MMTVQRCKSAGGRCKSAKGARTVSSRGDMGDYRVRMKASGEALPLPADGARERQVAERGAAPKQSILLALD